jgi:hypothetical protein
MNTERVRDPVATPPRRRGLGPDPDGIFPPGARFAGDPDNIFPLAMALGAAGLGLAVYAALSKIRKDPDPDGVFPLRHSRDPSSVGRDPISGTFPLIAGLGAAGLGLGLYAAIRMQPPNARRIDRRLRPEE